MNPQYVLPIPSKNSLKTIPGYNQPNNGLDVIRETDQDLSAHNKYSNQSDSLYNPNGSTNQAGNHQSPPRHGSRPQLNNDLSAVNSQKQLVNA